MQNAFGVSKRVVLGRDLSPEAHTGAPQDIDSYKKSRMGRLAAEEAKYEKMPAEDRRLQRGVQWDEHKKQSQDFDRWSKEMEAHGSDPVRAEQMRYAAKHNLDYPLKAPKRKVKTMKKDAFGVKREPAAVSKGLGTWLGFAPKGTKAVRSRAATRRAVNAMRPPQPGAAQATAAPTGAGVPGYGVKPPKPSKTAKQPKAPKEKEPKTGARAFLDRNRTGLLWGGGGAGAGLLTGYSMSGRNSS